MLYVKKKFFERKNAASKREPHLHKSISVVLLVLEGGKTIVQPSYFEETPWLFIIIAHLDWL